ncbi:hypothetical protein [Paraburkholderia sp. 22B1P]|uniref:hypothetical protein n=1 Tax=Paraburkholderia sp. 22B1P TaxID=3080498 RepID=UPI0030901E26|nr:hypothetical protein PBP221_85030 [Paraburkholderia sp. 22B1P]
MFSQSDFTCPTVDVRVTVARQTFAQPTIGTSAMFIQHDYGCSHERTCEHRMTTACRVRKLNVAG